LGAIAASQIELVVARARAKHPDGDVALLTSTVPHAATDDPRDVADWLYESRRAMRKTREWREFARELGIVAAIDVLDISHGGTSGTHFHFHSLLVMSRLPPVVRGESMRAALFDLVDGHDQRLRFRHGLIASAVERSIAASASDPEAQAIDRLVTQLAELGGTAAGRIWLTSEATFAMASSAFRRRWLAGIVERLSPAWLRVVGQRMARDGRTIGDLQAFRERALDLAPGEHAAAYLCGWGLPQEVGASTAKAKSHLRLLDLIAAWGHADNLAHRAAAADAATLYRADIRALRGRRWVYGLTRACETFAITDADVASHRAAQRKQRAEQHARSGKPTITPLSYAFRSDHWGTVLRLGRSNVIAWIDETAARLESAGATTAAQRAARVASASRDLDVERLCAMGARDADGARPRDPPGDLEELLQLEINAFLDARRPVLLWRAPIGDG
jgi:hypothetical protein